jgi:hypothetical protein
MLVFFGQKSCLTRTFFQFLSGGFFIGGQPMKEAEPARGRSGLTSSDSDYRDQQGRSRHIRGIVSWASFSSLNDSRGLSPSSPEHLRSTSEPEPWEPAGPEPWGPGPEREPEQPPERQPRGPEPSHSTRPEHRQPERSSSSDGRSECADGDGNASHSRSRTHKRPEHMPGR